MSDLKKTARIRDAVTKVAKLIMQDGIPVHQRGAKACVEYDRNGKPTAVILPMIPDNPSPEFLMAVQGFIDHECAHVLFTDSPALTRTRDAAAREGYNKDLLNDLTNAIEDVRIEAEMSKKFEGSAYNLGQTLGYVLDKAIAPAIEDAKSLPEGEERKLALMNRSLLPWFRAHAGAAEAQDFIKTHGLAEVLKPLDEAFPEIGKRLTTMKSSGDAAKLAVEIVKRLTEPEEPEAEEPEPEGDGEGEGEPGNGKGDGKPEPSDGKGDENSESPGKGENKEQDGEGAGGSPDPSESDKHDDGEGKSDGSSGEGEGEPEPGENGSSGKGEGEGEADDKSEGKPEPGEGKDGDGSPSESTVTPPKSQDDYKAEGDEKDGKGEPGGGKGGDVVSEMSGRYSPDDAPSIDDALSELLEAMAINEFKSQGYIDYTRDLDRIEVIKPRGNPDVEALEAKVGKVAAAMQKDLQRIIAARTLSINVPGFRSGRVNAPSLHRLKTGDDRVFRRKHVNETKDVAVSLVVDCSGSMRANDKINLAIESAFAFSQVLDRIGVANEVIGFTTHGVDAGSSVATAAQELSVKTGKGVRYEPIFMPIFKAFSERFTTGEVKKRFAYAHSDEGYGWKGQTLKNNVDGASLIYAAERLMPRREQRKVMIVFSDGAPAGGCTNNLGGGALRSHLKQVVGLLEQSGIETVGIGIMDSSVTAFYPKAIVVNRLDDLSKLVMAQLKRILTE